jgi:hypothetical protein
MSDMSGRKSCKFCDWNAFPRFRVGFTTSPRRRQSGPCCRAWVFFVAFRDYLVAVRLLDLEESHPGI